MNTDASKYSSQFKEIGDQLNTAAIKANEFNQALSGEGENGFQKHLQSVAEEIKKLNMDDADFKAAVASGDVDSINYLVEALKMQESLLEHLLVRYNHLSQRWEIWAISAICPQMD